MSHVDRKKPTKPSDAPVMELTTAAGVTVLVHHRAAPAPPPQAPSPPPRRGPRAVILPDNADRDAFIAELDAQWGGFIYKELSRYKDVAAASRQDLRQNVLIILCEHYDKQKEEQKPGEPDNVPAFLREVIHNAAVNHGRKKGRRVQIAPGAEVEEAPDAAMDPEGAVERAELLAKIEVYSTHLTSDEQQVLVAREVDQMTFEIIATAMGRPLSTVHDLHKRAILKLKGLAAASERGVKLGRGRRR